MSSHFPTPPPTLPPSANLPAPGTTSTHGALHGLRVIDLSRVMAGNMLSVQLADMGADVIKVESPEHGDPLRNWQTHGVPVWWRVYSRNKRSLAVDLRRPEGMTILHQLIATADILIENFRPGTLEAMGLAPNLLWQRQPRLVVVRISGWGQTGPYREQPGFGSLVEAYSGLAAKTGFEDRPPVLPNMTLADMITGLYGYGATLAALRAAERDGRGQVIDLSLFEAMLSVVGPDAADAWLKGEDSGRHGSRSPTAAPRNVYQAADDQWVALSATTEAMTRRLFDAIGRPELKDDPRCCTNQDRLANIDFVDDAIQSYMQRHDRAALLQHFRAAGVTVGPVMQASDLLHDAFVRERGALVNAPDEDCGTLPMHDVVPRLSHTPGSIRRQAPTLGEDSQALLQELGYGDADVATLVDSGVVRVSPDHP